MSEPATLTCLEMHTRSEPEESSSGTDDGREQGRTSPATACALGS
jgi:hypothetical protein